MIARLFGSSVSSSSKCTAAEKQVINRLADVLRSSACLPVPTYSLCFDSPEKIHWDNLGMLSEISKDPMQAALPLNRAFYLQA